jgi:uncharacterized protein YprB with RNaseH-like and TPR domain
MVQEEIRIYFKELNLYNLNIIVKFNLVLFQNQWIKITFLKLNDFHTDLIFCLRRIFTKLYEVIERLSNKCP